MLALSAPARMPTMMGRLDSRMVWAALEEMRLARKGQKKLKAKKA